MGNCPPLPCPPPCPEVSIQDLCANNNCHGCCIFHCCCNAKPGVPPEAPPRDFPPVLLRQQPHHLTPPRPDSAAKGAAARGTGGVAQDVPANGYRFRPSPWRAASGLVATERDSGSGVAPPGLPGNGGRPVPSVSRLAGSGSVETGATDHGGGVVRAPPPSWRTESGLAGTAWATGRDDGWGVVRSRGSPVQPERAETWATGRDAGAAAPLGVPGNAVRPVQSLSRHAGTGSADTGATGHGVGGAPSPPPSWRTESGSGGRAWTTGRDDGWGVVGSRVSPVHPARATGRDAGATAPGNALAAPLGVPGNGDRPVPQLSRWPGPGLGFDEAGFTWHDGSVVPRHGERREPPPSRRTTESGLAETTWATGRNAGAAAPDMPVAVAVEPGQDTGMQGDSSSPAPRGRLPLPSSSFSAGRLSPADSRVPPQVPTS
ncbi:hypothetical protein PAHAL_2G221700 [Panicum hallii]|uniref:Uncharacterized protein n=1 Tax=Panicum hallii TaxID=206008 RepID=A0A2T8KQ21_9POAL|nr:hypothetical protein PAHAL_2G221700 [Panicum hallii]